LLSDALGTKTRLSAAVLKAANQRIKYCYEQALHAEEHAANEQDDPERQRFWLDNQARWLALAVSIDYEARLSDSIKELRRYIKSPLCAACDFPMRPKRVVPSGNGLFEFQYECGNCGAKETVLEMNERRNGI
jgi:hypothetical protein